MAPNEARAVSIPFYRCGLKGPCAIHTVGKWEADRNPGSWASEPCLIKALPMTGLGGLSLPVPLENDSDLLVLVSQEPAEAQRMVVVHQVWMEGQEERREEGRNNSKQGLAPRVCGHLRTPISSLYPFPTCWGPSRSCHHA